MKTNLYIILTLISLSSIAQTTDTLNLYNAYCEASNPNEIDTTIFTYQHDTLYIRNIESGICDASRYRAVLQTMNDTLFIDIININGDCLGDCSMGYTIKTQIAEFDTLLLKLKDEVFTVIMSDIIVSAEKQGLSKFKVFPNPARDFVTIEKGKLQFNRITIFNINGKLVKQIDQNNLTGKLDISDLPGGQYIFSFETADKVITQKIIKIE